MNRLLLDTLLHWKRRSSRKPLLLDGARQTGKTYLLRELLGGNFDRVMHIDFLRSPQAASAFEGSLDPKDVLSALEILTGQAFDAATDLLILDEIGECQRAVTSLKFFAEQLPEAYIAASGSNIGLLGSFPVGKVEQHCVRPLSFREFLWAQDDPLVYRAFNDRASSAAAHLKLFDQLTNYYFTGGMPEAVATWLALRDKSLLNRTKAVSQVHENLVEGYRRDFGKYAGKINAQLIDAVFTAVPSQISSVLDESVKRFRFKDIAAGRSRYADFESAIVWLHRCRLSLKNYPIEGHPQSPLLAQRKENRVKLFLFDVGLLNHMLTSSYLEIKKQNYMFKGFVAENFVQQELAALGHEPSFSWADARAEIEFLLTDAQGRIFPVEVKSGARTRARSLQSYITKCRPHRTIKLIGGRGPDKQHHTNWVAPLYYAEDLGGRLLDSAGSHLC
jgi:predicted AAA+ superfamily ATPase